MKKLSIRNLRTLIEQEVKHELEHDSASDIEPVEDAFAGGENLVQPLVHVAITHDDIDEDDIPKAPEMLSLIDDEGVITVSESKLRSMVRSLLINSN